MKKNTTEAKVTDGALIVSVANENAPKIWRTDITHANTATFELQDRDDGETALVMRGGDNTEDVYVFADRALALSALYTVQAALFAGDTARNAPTAAKKKGSLFFSAIKALLVMGAIFVLLVFGVVKFFPRPAKHPLTPTTSSQSRPVPAEQLFGGR